ncbi:MAG: GNAT family N-acetyltransferase [Defluviitaleaceae bacterium]|nr:GNAT family N-acetyltransferase [Defluviitaleaceae bacterium]MCL2836862.1 GNAT family N-acetyltransferase [Defluviitaleaceae bacterium]
MNVVYSSTLSTQDYCKLRKSVDFYEISEEHVRRALDKSDFVISAAVDGAAVGMARLITDGTQVFIMDVAVHPDYQGNGIGRGLMERIRQYMDGLECRRVIVNLITDSSKEGFYEKLGYQKAEGMRLWLENIEKT